jgi:phosphate transport system substrate-binding protein
MYFMKKQTPSISFGGYSGVIASSILLSLALCSCSDNAQAPAQSDPGTGGHKVVIKGSNTIGEELAPRLIAEFKKEHPSTTFELESKATGYGIAGLLAGQADIAAASREPIKDERELAQSRSISTMDYSIGSYCVAVIVNASNQITDLTKEKVLSIFTGTIQNWKDLGGPDAPIHLCVRDPISGTYLGFRELALGNNPYAKGLNTFTNYAGIAQAVADDPNGIGYTSFQLASKPGVKAITIESIAPVAASVKEGKYPFARTLHFYTNKDKESEPTRQFIEFVQSPKGQAVVDQMGFVPH